VIVTCPNVLAMGSPTGGSAHAGGLKASGLRGTGTERGGCVPLKAACDSTFSEERLRSSAPAAQVNA
jgi:hypothetical protein